MTKQATPSRAQNSTTTAKRQVMPMMHGRSKTMFLSTITKPCGITSSTKLTMRCHYTLECACKRSA
ncbi:Uncharacterised protein [Vibrio cholerae]|nr:Uncharacterised protein [Vibrio cholerae]